MRNKEHIALNCIIRRVEFSLAGHRPVVCLLCSFFHTVSHHDPIISHFHSNVIYFQSSKLPKYQNLVPTMEFNFTVEFTFSLNQFFSNFQHFLVCDLLRKLLRIRNGNRNF